MWRVWIFLGAFDAEKIAFLPFAAVQDVFAQNDAPWDMLKKKYSLYDRDFYLAELNVDDNGTADISDDKVATDFYITFNANGQNKYRIQRKKSPKIEPKVYEYGFLKK